MLREIGCSKVAMCSGKQIPVEPSPVFAAQAAVFKFFGQQSFFDLPSSVPGGHSQQTAFRPFRLQKAQPPRGDRRFYQETRGRITSQKIVNSSAIIDTISATSEIVMRFTGSPPSEWRGLFSLCCA